MTEMTIATVLDDRAVVTTGPGATVAEACAALDRHNIGALAVLDGKRLVGILSERDVIRRCIAAGLSPGQTLVAEVMTRAPATVTPKEPVMAALDLMQGFGFRHLPVVDEGGGLLSMLSMRDIPKEFRMVADRVAPLEGPCFNA